MRALRPPREWLVGRVRSRARPASPPGGGAPAGGRPAPAERGRASQGGGSREAVSREAVGREAVGREATLRGSGPAGDRAGAPHRGGWRVGPGPHIDPRFARRWVEVRREQGRRRLRILLASLGAVATAAVAAGVVYSPLMEVRHVRVAGADTAVRSEVLHVSGLARAPLMVHVRSGAIAARLDAIPDLGGAHVSRSWPFTVEIRLTVRTPVAAVARTGAGPHSWATVDATGRVLADVASIPRGLPTLTGVGAPPPPGSWFAGSPGARVGPVDPGGPPLADLNAAADSASAPGGIAAALAIAAALPKAVRAQVLSVDVAADGALSLSLAPRSPASGPVLVILGDGSHLGAKITALATLVGEAHLSGVRAIDLTVPDRPVTRSNP